MGIPPRLKVNRKSLCYFNLSKYLNFICLLFSESEGDILGISLSPVIKVYFFRIFKGVLGF